MQIRHRGSPREDLCSFTPALNKCLQEPFLSSGLINNKYYYYVLIFFGTNNITTALEVRKRILHNPKPSKRPFRFSFSPSSSPALSRHTKQHFTASLLPSAILRSTRPSHVARIFPISSAEGCAAYQCSRARCVASFTSCC